MLSRSWLLPLAIWAAAAACVALVAGGHGYGPRDSATWSRWDSLHYEGIARDGYDLHRCRSDEWPDAEAWCGDAGWFPGYPWLVHGLHLLGLPIRGTAVVLSWLFAAATLVLLWLTFLGRRRDVATGLALAYAAWAPGQVYHYAVFPLSMLAFFTVAHLWLLRRGRFVAAGSAGAIAALAYPPGVLLAPISAVSILAQRSKPLAERARRLAACSCLVLAGAAAVLVAQALETGRWNAYFLVQEKYGHTFQNPIAATRDSLRPLVEDPSFTVDLAPALQTALVTAALLACLVWVAVRRRSAGRLEGLLVVWACATWALPLSQGAVSLPRSQAALLPLAILVHRLPRPLAAMLVAVALLVAILMEQLFLEGKLT